ncbi:C40 family peptidase [bacterium]|nr:C40 family peptidase [bacterium]
MEKEVFIQGVIQVSTADIFREPTFASEKITEGILWEKVKILQVNENQKWLKIQLPDFYEGWIYHLQIKKLDENEFAELEKMPKVCLWKTITHLQKEPNLKSEIVTDAVIGTIFPKISEEGDWVKVKLPFAEAFILAKRLKTKLSGETKQEKLIELAKSFLGTPYVWGGKSAKGFDCSGFVQTTFKLFGINLPRDSKDQFLVGKTVKKNNLAKGDLVFFSEEKTSKINHVGIAIDEFRFIHSSGWVKINSFNSNDENYDKNLSSWFVEGKRLIKN